MGTGGNTGVGKETVKARLFQITHLSLRLVRDIFEGRSTLLSL
jgi:hypothetical protein